ncbi:MAG: 2-dehydropantoate 2-reductase [Candidatus Eremiobacteraeota bacterium]|nr:2-dehydropantoate 2-reductase [Candidatus Eremiobacteraeota bacterium]
MRILIIGAGAIGTMLGVRLTLSGKEVTYHDRPEVIAALAKDGLSMVVDGKTHRVSQVRTDGDLSGGLRRVPYDLAILCVKAYHTEEAVKKLDRSLFTSLLTIQNGVGNEEFLISRFGADQLFSGAITLPVGRNPAGVPEIANARGGIGVAPVRKGDSCEEVLTLFKRADFVTRIYGDYRALKWSKLLINMLGNAASALLAVPPQEIFYDRRLTGIEKEAFLEALEVMKKMKIAPVDLPSYPVRLIALLFSLASPTMLEVIVNSQKSMSRGSKMPSLYLDLESGSGSSEVEVLNGAVAREGERLGVRVPVNKFLYRTLDAMAKGRIPRDRFRGKREEFLEALLEAREGKGDAP